MGKRRDGTFVAYQGLGHNHMEEAVGIVAGIVVDSVVVADVGPGVVFVFVVVGDLVTHSHLEHSLKINLRIF